MAKPFKIFLGVIGVLFVLIVGTAIAVPLFFNPNDYKPQIAAAVKENTGRDLTITGDIDLSIFPWLGVSLADVTLGNAKGFGPEPFAHLKSMDVRVKILPLLTQRRVEIGKVSVDGLALNLARNKDGVSNWDDLVKASDSAKPAKPEKPAAAPPVALAVGGLDIRDVALSYVDQQAKKSYKLEKLSLVTGEITLKDPIKLTLAFLATATDPDVSADVKLSLTAHHDLDTQVYEAHDLDLKVSASGKAVPDGKQDVTVKSAMVRFDQESGIAELTGLVAEAMGAKVSSKVRFDQKADTVALGDMVVEASGVKISANIQGSAITSDAPKLTGKLSSNTFNPRDLAKTFKVELPPMQDATALTAVSFSSDYSGDLKSAKLDNLKLKLDQSNAAGFVHVTDIATQTVQFGLKLDAIDADRYLAPPEPESAKKGDSGDFRKTELPIAALDEINAKGRLEIGSLVLKKAKLANVVLDLDAPKGKVKTQSLSAKLYGGTLVQSARITPGPKPTYTMIAGLDGVNSQPLLKDFAGKEFLSGLGDFKLNIASGGTTIGDALKGLNGTVSTAFLKGAVEGFNLKQKIQKAKATYRQEAAVDAGPERTPFSDLKGAGTITNGLLKTDTLKVNGTDYNMTGDGNIDLAGLTIDYVLRPSYTGGSDLAGLSIPVKITGNLFSPNVKVDLATVLKDTVRTEVKQELQKQEEKLKDKAVKKLGDFFNKQKAPPAPAPAEDKPADPAPPSNQQ